MADETIAPKEFSRKAARASGFKFYHGGPCSKGHGTKRYTSGGRCVECAVIDALRKQKDDPQYARDRNKRYHQRHPEKNLEKDRRLRQDPERNKKKLDRTADWVARNPDYHRNYYQTTRRFWRSEKVDFRLRQSLRNRLNVAIKRQYRAGSAVRDLGCSIAEFREYIAAQFTDGMAWENWGAVWELDHKVPLASFDLTDREQFLRAAHYTNYQPLSVEAHKAKTADELRRAA